MSQVDTALGGSHVAPKHSPQGNHQVLMVILSISGFLQSCCGLDSLVKICLSSTTKNKNRLKRYLGNFDIVEQKAKEIEAKDKVRNFKPPISGKLIMETLDLKPCKEVGLIKNKIKEAILEGSIENNYDQAYAYMFEVIKEMNLKIEK